jgi:response regulator of citrate/malate metabolism
MTNSKYKVLIVEDDPMVAQIDKNYTEKNNYVEVVGTSRNGIDALDFLSKHDVDLIILDYYLPKMDGNQFLKALREKYGFNHEVIMVTAQAKFDEVRKSYANGCLDYLIKPFDYQRFKKSIDKFVAIKQYDREKYLTQQEIDSLYNFKSEKNENGLITKGIQGQTLLTLTNYLKENANKEVTCEDITKFLPLSIVTVRHYLKYLVDEDYVETRIDYDTGGRPRVIYTYKG